ncbi:MAG: ABC transporter ATP-binding protein [Candidatus Wallbacteria bacterium]|nr:ABC transporter ATP-binding protein [Candidatus Wallbacteria bacterium]MBI4867026.1 ABC transporter ATP-binding protein [Candidatus Wallbacteria bacterium]
MLLSLRNASLTYPSEVAVTALREVNLDINRGEMIALVGASGSGKSTLLAILGLLKRPSDGEYYFDGRPTRHLSEGELCHLRNRRIGFIFQHHLLLPELTALENVALNQILTGRDSWKNAREKAAKLLSALGLENRLDHHARQLSGGEQQRVAVARALINNPDLILADEPTGNLDSENSRRLLAIFRSLFGKGDYTLIIATHSQQVARICPRLLVIRDGVVSDESQPRLALARASA